jgi:hypothetical protein
LSSKSVAFDELVVWEHEAHEQLLEYAQKTLSERDYSSSMVAHVVSLLKSHTSDLDTEQLQSDFAFDNDEERDALIDNVYDTAQHFMSEYDFSAINDPNDNGSLGGQS